VKAPFSTRSDCIYRSRRLVRGRVLRHVPGQSFVEFCRGSRSGTFKDQSFAALSTRHASISLCHRSTGAAMSRRTRLFRLGAQSASRPGAAAIAAAARLAGCADAKRQDSRPAAPSAFGHPARPARKQCVRARGTQMNPARPRGSRAWHVDCVRDAQRPAHGRRSDSEGG
jgi:hypothetical protein